jgi:hypothetical protein
MHLLLVGVPLSTTIGSFSWGMMWITCSWGTTSSISLSVLATDLQEVLSGVSDYCEDIENGWRVRIGKQI